jgi:hypothetical protein
MEECHAPLQAGHPVTTGVERVVIVLKSKGSGYWIARSSRAMTLTSKHLFVDT